MRLCIKIAVLACSLTWASSACGGPTAPVLDSPTELDQPVHTSPPISAADGGPPQHAPAAPVALETSPDWPFFSWTRVTAYTFNRYEPKRAELLVFSEASGWNESRVEGPTLSGAQTQAALSMLETTQGQLVVSKCAFPRHALVFFQGEVPVASINVCFECGDILIWPAYRQTPDWQERKTERMGKLMKAYDRVFPKWETFFDAELGLPKDWKQLPLAPSSKTSSGGGAR